MFANNGIVMHFDEKAIQKGMVLPWHPRGYAQILGAAPECTVGTNTAVWIC